MPRKYIVHSCQGGNKVELRFEGDLENTDHGKMTFSQTQGETDVAWLHVGINALIYVVDENFKMEVDSRLQ